MEYLRELMPSLLEGTIETMKIFTISLGLSLPLGLVLALIRKWGPGLVKSLVAIYVLILRGTPLMLQIVFIFFGLPAIGLSLDRYLAVIMAFVLNYAAYFAEIFRGGIDSMDRGQYEAAKVLGFTSYKSFRTIILPQLIKNVLAPISNEVISLLKDSSLVYVVGIGELLRAGKIASNRDASLIPLVMVGIIYLFINWLLSLGLARLEKLYDYYE